MWHSTSSLPQIHRIRFQACILWHSSSALLMSTEDNYRYLWLKRHEALLWLCSVAVDFATYCLGASNPVSDRLYFLSGVWLTQINRAHSWATLLWHVFPSSCCFSIGHWSQSYTMLLYDRLKRAQPKWMVTLPKATVEIHFKVRTE